MTKPLRITLSPVADGISISVKNADAWGLSDVAARQLARGVYRLVRALRKRRAKKAAR